MLQQTNLNCFGKFLQERTPPGEAHPLSRLLFVKCYENKLDMVCFVRCSIGMNRTIQKFDFQLDRALETDLQA